LRKSFEKNHGIVQRQINKMNQMWWERGGKRTKKGERKKNEGGKRILETN
jgi:hypothetical protein